MLGAIINSFNPKNIDIADNRKSGLMKKCFKMCLSEFLGTSFLLFFGCMGCSTKMYGGPVAHHFVALSFGLTVTASIQIFGHISGCHINPQLTLVSFILGKTEALEALFYLVGQFSGAICGYILLWAVLPDKTYRNGLCLNNINGNITVYQGLIVEIISTALLALVCASIWDSKNAKNSDSVPLRLGLIIAAIAMVAGPFTGASMNSARSFAPALINNFWENHWIYWIGPTLGSIIASVVYKFLFEHVDGKDKEQTTESVDEGRL